MNENENINEQTVTEEQPTPTEQKNAPEVEDPPLGIKAMLLVAVIVVLLFAVFFVIPAMDNGVKGTTSILEESGGSGNKELFQR